MLTTIAAGRTFDFSHCYGMYSMGGLGFWDPVDFAFGSGGMLYVVSRGAEELGQRLQGNQEAFNEGRQDEEQEDRDARIKADHFEQAVAIDHRAACRP